jgi:hypothetical protein
MDRKLTEDRTHNVDIKDIGLRALFRQSFDRLKKIPLA